MIKERGTATQRGYNSRWSRYSIRYRRLHPFCTECQRQGILKQADCVDHIIPVNGPDDPLFWDENNHQSLCISCHSEKTAREDGGFGNKPSDKPRPGADKNGQPTDSIHHWNK
jgi:5-methylcytosine-specific restriction protein A